MLTINSVKQQQPTHPPIFWGSEPIQSITLNNKQSWMVCLLHRTFPPIMKSHWTNRWFANPVSSPIIHRPHPAPFHPLTPTERSRTSKTAPGFAWMDFRILMQPSLCMGFLATCRSQQGNAFVSLCPNIRIQPSLKSYSRWSTGESCFLSGPEQGKGLLPVKSGYCWGKVRTERKLQLFAYIGLLSFYFLKCHLFQQSWLK